MESRIRFGTAVVISVIGVIAMGCFERSLRPVNPCTRSNVGETIRVSSVDEVDLLFMIDNSNSMGEEQASLTAELPNLVRILASGDYENDGTQDFTPVRSLHIGVVNSDMGSGSFMVPTCASGMFGTRFGDDGILLTRGRTTIPGCMATYPSIFEFTRGGDATAFANEVACVATTGTGGCGFEQQLESPLKALSPSTPQPWTVAGYVPPLFHEGSQGHADRENMGFIRQNSALAILMFTDEEDCSWAIADLVNPSSPTYGTTDLNLRCFTYPDAVQPVERFIRGADGHSGLLGLRQNPNLLIFGAIVGVPPDLVADPDAIDYNAILADDRMRERPDPGMPTRLTPSCDTARGIAFPPRRIVRVAQGIEAAGGSAIVQSICQASYTAALNAIIEKIANALGGACLPRDLNPDAQGFVGCEVFEILPTTGDVTACAGLAGRDDLGTIEVDGVTRGYCRVQQVGPGPGTMTTPAPGWYYEIAEATPPGSDIRTACGDTGQRIHFTISPITNSDIRLECLQTVQPGGGGVASVGTFCDPASDVFCAMGNGPAGPGHPLSCDAAARSCGIPCGDTSACTAAGLLGDVCDSRSWEQAVGADIAEPTEADRLRANLTSLGINPTDPHHFCVNPTCI